MKKTTFTHFSSDDSLESLKRGLGIAPRLFILIFALLSLMVVSSIISYRKYKQVNTAFFKIQKEIPHERAIMNTLIAITDYVMPANDHLITGDPKEFENSKELEIRVSNALKNCIEKSREEEKPYVEKVEQDYLKIQELSDRIFTYKISSPKDLEEAGKVMEQMDDLVITSRRHIKELLKIHDTFMNKFEELAEKASRSANRWKIWMLILATILGLAIATYIALSILTPLTMLDTSATKIAGGDLSELLYIEGKGEISSLTESFNKMILSLRHQIETSKTILNAVADPIFTVDNNLRITYFSPACEELTGYSSKEAIGKICSTIFKSNICADRCAIQKSAKENRSIHNVEVEIETKKGQKIPIMASASSLKNYCNDVKGGCEVFTDISEWKRMTAELKNAQEQLLQAERLAVLGRLASTVGHELRNPMAVIQNAAYYINSKIGQDDPKLRKHLKIIEFEIDIANKIIADLLEFSVGNKKKEKPTTPIDLNQLIDLATERIQIKKEVTINKKIDEDIPLIIGDEHQILQVLINLISNADQAIHFSGGEIQIITQKKDNNVDLLIKDNGCGIDEEDINKIFDPFFTTKPKGIGLGLATSKSIIDNHDAILEIKSDKEKGTTFIIHFTTIYDPK